MNILRIENRVRDYDSWKHVFDRFEALRREKGVRSYRVTRRADDPLHLFIDLSLDSASRAEDFHETLARIWRTPQSREHLAEHGDPLVLDVVAEGQYPGAISIGPPR